MKKTLSFVIVFVLGLGAAAYLYHRSDENYSAKHMKVSCRIKGFENNQYVLSLTEDVFSINFVRISKSKYDDYTQRIRAAKQAYSQSPNELNEQILSIANEYYIGFMRNEESYLGFSRIDIDKEYINDPFEVRLKKGYYVVHLLQKGYVYFKPLAIEHDLELVFSDNALYFH